MRPLSLTAASGALVSVCGLLMLGAPAAFAGASHFQAGYQASLAAKPEISVKGTVSVPRLDCPAKSNSYMFEDIDAVFPSDNEQGMLMELGCSNGSAYYIPEFNRGKYDPVKVTAGNRLEVTLTATKSTISASMTDLTTHKGYSYKWSNGYGEPTGALFDVEPATNGDDPYPIPQFDTIGFSSATVNGKTLASLHPTAYTLERGSTVLIAAGPLGSAGTGFTLTFRHS